jgi:sugar phosphate isomerase/epimerase
MPMRANAQQPLAERSPGASGATGLLKGSRMTSFQFPKLHNAMWPGLVGKGADSEPCIDLDTMLRLTTAAEVNGVKFDGVDIFLYEPHINIEITDDELKRVAEKIASHGLVVGSVVAPVWGPTGGGSAMGSAEDRQRFVGQVKKACRIAQQLRKLGVRPHGIIRIDSAAGIEDWLKDPEPNTRLIARTFSEACDVAEAHGERLAAEGEICWGGMHSWRQMVKLLELVGRPKTLGFQADMAHTLLYVLGYNAPEDALLPADWNWSDPARLDEAYKTLTSALRPWTIDFHVAQNDATVKGSGSHDKTGRHCLADDPNGKLDIAHHAGFWLRDAQGGLTKAVHSLCWDGCMFPNAVMMDPQTWNNILAAMISVRQAHGWNEEPAARPAPPTGVSVEVAAPRRKAAGKPRKPAKAVRPAKRKPTPKAAKAAKPISRAKPAKPAKLAGRAVAKSAKAKQPKTKPVAVKAGKNQKKTMATKASKPAKKAPAATKAAKPAKKKAAKK